MYGQLVESTEPDTDTIDATYLKNHVRFESTAEDTLIGYYIKAAREQAEKFCNRSFVTTTWIYYLQDFPRDSKTIELPKSPLQSITSIQYRDTDGNAATLSSGSYTYDTKAEPPLVRLKDSYSWPNTDADGLGNVWITFDAGYGDDDTDVPEGIRLALAFYAAHYFEAREPGDSNDMPKHVQTMLRRFRVI